MPILKKDTIIAALQAKAERLTRLLAAPIVDLSYEGFTTIRDHPDFIHVANYSELEIIQVHEVGYFHGIRFTCKTAFGVC